VADIYESDWSSGWLPVRRQMLQKLLDRANGSGSLSKRNAAIKEALIGRLIFLFDARRP